MQSQNSSSSDTNTVYLVTGNPNKLRELIAIAPPKLNFQAHALDIDEIQSLDQHEIVRDKLQKAFAAVQAPVVLEDVSAGLASLNGLPGPFIRFFEERLGRGALYILSKAENDHVTIRCLAGYYDGERMLFGEGVVEGTITAPRGDQGFGFDCVVVPDGQTRTTAEMSDDEKNATSHRALAFKNLLGQITN